MDARIISDAGVSVNNVSVGIVPNSVKYTEGKGEQKVHAVSAGGGSAEMAYADDVSSKFSKVSFEILPTAANISLARQWKCNGNANVVHITGANSFSRTFSYAALVNNYEVNLAADGKIQIEFHSAACA